jgi:glutaredoxin
VPQVLVTLLGKPGCHLCDDARAVVQQVIAELPDGTAELTERNILEDAALAEQHADDIPVVLIDGRAHVYWRVDAERFRAAVLTAAR